MSGGAHAADPDRRVPHSPSDPGVSPARFEFRHLVRGLPRVVRAALLAQAAVLLLGVFGWPLHQAPDEPWHVDLVVAVADGRAVPWPGPGTLKQSKGVEAGLVPAGLQGTTGPTYCGCRTWTADTAPDPWPSWADAGGATPTRQPNWMVQHPPAYYAVMAVPLRLLPDWPHRPYDVLVYWLRVANLVFLLPLPLLAFLAASRLSGDEAVGSTASVLMLAVPFLQHLGSSVNNDNLLILLFGAVTVLLAYVVRGDTSVRTALLVGLLTAAALLTKGTALVLPAVVPVAYVLARALLPGVLALGSGLALGGWWWVRNELAYGTVQPNGLVTDQTLAGRRPRVTTVSESGMQFAASTVDRTSETLWLNTAVRTLPGWIDVTSTVLSVLTVALLAVGLVAWVRRGLGVGSGIWTLLPVLGIGAIVVVGALEHWLRTERIGGVQGRYLYPALVALAAPVALGVVTLARRWAVPAVAVGAVALQVAYGLAVAREFWLPRTPDLRLAEAWRNATAWSPLPAWAYALVILLAAAGLAWLLAAAAPPRAHLDGVRRPGDVSTRTTSGSARL